MDKKMAAIQSSSVPLAAVIGGGPAGLMAAEALAGGGAQVDLYDGMPSVGRKFLVAGKGGLNLTHSEPREEFLGRYGDRREWMEAYLSGFGQAELRAWAEGLGIETFTGTSGRVFPAGMKAAPLLYRWRQRLAAAGVRFHMRHKWHGWDEGGSLRFDTAEGEKYVNAQAVVLALGGASWSQLGSDGAWTTFLAGAGIALAPFKPSNCGFEVAWSEIFRAKYDGQPLKAITLSFTDAHGRETRRQGEFIVTTRGVEGSLIYAFSAPIRDEIEARGQANIYLDLAPDWSAERLAERLSRPRGSRSLASHLEKTVHIKGVKAGLLWEFVPRQDFANPGLLAACIKNLPIPLLRPFPLDEAISSAGGVRFEELDSRLMLRRMPGVFCAGEMLDWEAPTGGYLMTGCFATGRAAGLGALAWLRGE